MDQKKTKCRRSTGFSEKTSHSHAVSQKAKNLEPVFVVRQIQKKTPKYLSPKDHISFVSRAFRTKDGLFTRRPIRRQYSPRSFFIQHKISVGIFFILCFLSLETHFFDRFSYLFRASLLDIKPVSFTGTIFPLEKLPDWARLSESERNMTYDQIPPSKFVAVPEYNPSLFQIGKNYLASSVGRERELNAYISFSVPYLGNYEFDGTENSGSHPGIDIKAPKGTPVRAIANGIVYKAEKSNQGFGDFVTIAHVGIPDPVNPSQKTTIYSTYAHLSQISVRVGEEVSKGYILGKTGDSGLATTPHLHFQIDKSDAPFVPYWPFSNADVRAAGYKSFFDAIRYGLGKSNAKQYTLHPVQFVSQFQNFVPENLVVSATTVPSQTSSPVPNANTDASQIIVSEIKQAPVSASKTTASSAVKKNNTTSRVAALLNKKKDTLRIASSETKVPKTLSSETINEPLLFEPIKTYIPGQEKTVRVMINQNRLVAFSGIEIGSTLEDLAFIQPKVLTPADFKNGIANVKIKTDVARNFKLVARGEFGEVKSESLRAQIFEDIAPNDRDYDAILYLKQNGIISGYPDGTFRKDATLNRAEAIKLIFSAYKIVPEKGRKNIFVDVPENSWFTHYVLDGVERGFISGYPENRFRPEKQISRAEFLKASLVAAGIRVSPQVLSDPYSDIKKDSPFAPYFEFSRVHNLLPPRKGGFAVPSQPITRLEAALVLFGLSRNKFTVESQQ